MPRTTLKETKLGEWFRNKAPKMFDLIGDVVPGGEALKAISALIDATTVSEEEKAQARMMLSQAANADRASARNREIEVTKILKKRDWMQSFVGVAAMVIGIVMVIWAKSGVEDKEIFFHILGFAEGTLVGQVVNYYFGSSQK
jgi:hypothetical protein